MSVMKGLTLTTKEQNRLSIMNGVLEHQWAVSEAAELLGLSERHTWRLLAAYRKEGAAALAHGNRNHSPANATSSTLKAQVITLASGLYQGVNHSHFTELLAEREGIILSRSTIRRFLSSAGLSSSRHRKSPRHRCRRERMPQEGMLIQIDGSHHAWLGERGPWLTLLLAVDDATGSVPFALFQEQEDTEGYFRLMQGITQRKGIPLALYSDRYVVFRYHDKKEDTPEGCLTKKRKLTQFGRAMQELGVTQVFARSPEAKGRIERANGTFQDRLVAELRLAGISTLEEANRFLQEYLPRFNDRFAVPAAQPEPAYRPIPPGLDIEGILCFKERRRVAKDNTVQYQGKTLQIFPSSERTTYAGAHVEVQKRLDGRLLVYYKGKILTPGEAPLAPSFLRHNPENDTAQELAETEDKEYPIIIPPPKPKIIWYVDPEMKRAHRDLVKAGMERARKLGKRIGRPRVAERPDFTQRFSIMRERLGRGEISRNKAAKDLGIGYATLKRLMDNSSLSSEVINSINSVKELAEVLY
jgi:transposase